MSILGAIIPAIGGVLGSLFGSNKEEKAAEKQAEIQREFAQNGVRWKVEDAKAAGIHPLYALGANTTAYSPVSVGGQDWATTGQNMGSAIAAMTTQKEKADGFQKTVQDLTIQKMGLENEVLASQLRMVNQPGRGPGMPGGPTTAVIDGQPNSATTFQSGGIKIVVDPANTQAQNWENQYGEIGGEIGGASNLVHDLFKTLPGGKIPSARAGEALAEALKLIIKKGAAKAKSEPRDPVFNENFW